VAAAEADEGAKKGSVATARSDSLLAARVTLANGQVETCLRWRAVTRAARMRRSLLSHEAVLSAEPLVVASAAEQRRADWIGGMVVGTGWRLGMDRAEGVNVAIRWLR